MNLKNFIHGGVGGSFRKVKSRLLFQRLLGKAIVEPLLPDWKTRIGRRSPQVLTFQFSFQNFADERGVGFAFGELHHLALERIERGDFAGLNPVPNVRRSSST